MIFLDFPELTTTVPIGAIIALSGLIYTWLKIARESRKSRKEDAAAVLQAAKEEDALIKAKLEARIEKVDAQLQNLELNINKDMNHLKETYASEIKNLGSKIEILRDELRSTHGQLVTLLTTLIEAQSKKD